MRDVTLFFDFVSPYVHLALIQLEAFEREQGVRIVPRPAVYAALLEHHGLVGPAESPAKRRYTFVDVGRSAELLGVPLVGPPAHPFRSLEALRVVCIHEGSPRLLELVVSLSRACWAEGRDLTDAGVLQDAVARVGLDATELASRVASAEIKERLRASTAAAIDAGAFGVPTFVLEGEVFWGSDRLAHLAARLTGRLPDVRDRAEVILARPRGADRPAVAARNAASKG